MNINIFGFGFFLYIKKKKKEMRCKLLQLFLLKRDLNFKGPLGPPAEKWSITEKNSLIENDKGFNNSR